MHTFSRSDAGQARYLIHQVVKVGYVVYSYLHMICMFVLRMFVCMYVCMYKSRGAIMLCPVTKYSPETEVNRCSCVDHGYTAEIDAEQASNITVTDICSYT